MQPQLHNSLFARDFRQLAYRLFHENPVIMGDEINWATVSGGYGPPEFSGSAGFINQADSTTTAEIHTSTSSSSSLAEKTAIPSASRSKTLTKSLTRPNPLIGAWTTSTTISSSTPTALAAYTPYAFAQMIDNTEPNFLYQVTEDQLLSTPFKDIVLLATVSQIARMSAAYFKASPTGSRSKQRCMEG